MKLLQLFEGMNEANGIQVLWHGTTEEWFSKMQTMGVPAKSFWTPDEDMAWYFAQMAQEAGGRGDTVIAKLPIAAFDPSGFAVDNAMLQEPVDGVAEYHGFDHLPSSEWDNEIYELWSQTGQTWQDSLEVLRSVRYLKQLPPFQAMLNEAHNPDVSVKKKGPVYHAYLKGKWVGQAMVYDYEDEKVGEDERYIWKVSVDPTMKRQGIATAMYDVIADDLESQGLKLVPSPDQQLSPEAYQFWKSRDIESIKGHGTYKAEELQHFVGREIEVRGRPVVVTRVGWAKVSDAPLIGVRFTDVPEGSVNSTSQVRFDDVKDQLS